MIDARSRWIAEGVVSGISGYGNSVGVPTVGGEIVFDETYQGNPLVNVFCLGVLPVERLVLGRASGVGNLAVLLGSTTGRDGIGGVSVLASAGFSDDEADAAKRPSVQVGDPFEEKRLIEACLALLDAGLVVGIQDLGGAGLTCATSETASRGGVGMDVDVSEVPRREAGMEPFEVMTSESQERMLAIVEPEHLDEVLSICRALGGARRRRSADGHRRPGGCGSSTARRRGAGRRAGGGAARGRAAATTGPLAGPPAGRRAWPTPPTPPWRPRADAGADLLDLLADTSWVWSQYDHQLFLNTVEGPGGDAAVLRLKHPLTGADTGRGLALTTDGNHRWCALDPRRGTALVVAEAVVNLACVGARPLAVVNCLNFGNPEHPEVMWQLSEAIDGMAEACRALRLPVVGGNVSLYNESRGPDIDPTPVVGVLGLVDRLGRRRPGVGLVDGDRAGGAGPPSRTRCRGPRGPGGTATGAARCPPSTSARTPVPSASWCGASSPTGWSPACTTSPTGGWAWRWPRWRCGPAWASRSAAPAPAATAGCSPSRRPGRAVRSTRAALGEVRRRSRRAGARRRRLGEAGGDRLSVEGLLDLAARRGRRRLARPPARRARRRRHPGLSRARDRAAVDRRSGVRSMES